MTIAARQWAFTLSAIGLIGGARLGEVKSAGLYLFYVLAAQTLALAPIVMYAVAPQQAAILVKTAHSWLERYDRVIAITVSLIFGAWFLYQGITGLIG